MSLTSASGRLQSSMALHNANMVGLLPLIGRCSASCHARLSGVRHDDPGCVICIFRQNILYPSQYTFSAKLFSTLTHATVRIYFELPETRHRITPSTTAAGMHMTPQLPIGWHEILTHRSVKDKLAVPRDCELCPVGDLPIVTAMVADGVMVWIDRTMFGATLSREGEAKRRVHFQCDIYQLTLKGIRLCNEHGIGQR